MSDPENFVARWSRLKRESAQEKASEAPAPSEPAEDARKGGAPDAGTGPKAAGEAEPAPPFDPESLPPIDSITAGSDIRAFLQKGVPKHLTRAALRRVWTTDPAIRDFIGMAENQWDFTDPTAMPGFGPLAPSDDVSKLVAQAMGTLGEPGEPAPEGAPPIGRSAPAPAAALTSREDDAQTQAVGMPEEMQQGVERSAAVEAQQSEENVAAQQDTASAESLSARNRRGHGSALPE